MTGMIYIGDLEGITVEMVADMLRNPTPARDQLTELFNTDVPAIVVDVIADDATVVSAAASAVGAQLTAADVIIGSDKRVLPVPTKTGWYSMPESTGYTFAFVVVEQRDWYILGGFLLDGSFSARMASDTGSSAASRTSVPDAIVEWWVGKPQLNDDTVTVGAMGAKGAQLAVDFNERSSAVATQVAKVPVDDHNVGAVCVVPRRGILEAYTYHGADNLLRVVAAGGNGLGSTLRGKTEYSFTMGGAASYAQPWLLAQKRSGNTDTFFIPSRVALRWSAREIVADWSTGVVTANPGTMQLIEFPEQVYIDTFPVAYDANGNVTKLGIVAGYNPAAGRDDVYLLELDLTTYIMHDKANPAVTINITSGTPLLASALTPVLADKGAGTRRIFEAWTTPGSQTWKILTCEYTGDVDPSGVITETSYNVSTFAVTGTRTFGAAGRHLERYPGGACFDAAGKVWHVNEASNVFKLSQEGVEVMRSAETIFRPRGCPTGSPFDVLVNKGITYTNYLAWSGGSLLAVKKGS